MRTITRRLFLKVYESKDPPPMDDVLEALVQGGWRGTRTHLDASGIRTDATPEEIRRIVGEVAARRAGERSRGQPRGVNE